MRKKLVPLAALVVAGLALSAVATGSTHATSGTGTVTSAQLKSMKAGTTYVNVHTAKNPDGEIRGQITMSM